MHTVYDGWLVRNMYNSMQKCTILCVHSAILSDYTYILIMLCAGLAVSSVCPYAALITPSSHSTGSSLCLWTTSLQT